MNKEETQKLLAKFPSKHYVYVLKDTAGAPFYVGLGQRSRLFQHEEEARDQSNNSAKSKRIREITQEGKAIDYEIDSFHDETPWHREEEVIRNLSNTYQLTNSQ